MHGYNYYIRINENNEITDAFSDGFKQPEENDIQIASNQAERCFSLNCTEHIEGHPVYMHVYDGEVRRKTESEIYTNEFISHTERQRTFSTLAKSDIEIIRGIEDILDILISKEIINENRVPDSLLKKLKNRKAIRDTLRG